MDTFTALQTSYLWHRSHGRIPRLSLQAAKADVAANKWRYLRSPFKHCVGPAFAAYGETNLRWVENTDAIGLRSVGFADEIIRLDHRGWFTNEFQDETYRGAVYQLPGKDGKARIVYGYDDPNNKGAALLCFDFTEDKEEAARWADQIAERCAETEREYQEAWQAGREFEELGERIQDIRAERRALVREMRQACRAVVAGGFANIRKALLASLAELREESAQAFKRRESLHSDFGHQSGFVE